MSKKTVRFKVSRHSYSEKATTDPVFKVHFENNNGDTMVLVSNSTDIYKGLPFGETVDVKISKAQKTLEDIPEAE